MKIDPTEGDDAATAELDGLLGAVDDFGAPDPFEPVEASQDDQAAGDAGSGQAEGDGQANRSGPPATVPYKRLQQVVRQRNELNAKLAEVQAAESKLRNELSGAQGFRDAFQARYGKFRNPVAQLALDADFMSAMETLAKTDAEVGTFYKKVMTTMGTNNSPVTPEKAQSETPAIDPRLDAVLNRHAELTIKDVLNPLNLQERYQKMVVSHVMQNADIASLTPSAVKQLTRQFITDSGFTLDEMRKAKETPVAPAKPKTAGVGGGASPAASPKGAQKVEPKKFKNREEYLEHRASMLDGLISELMVPSE